MSKWRKSAYVDICQLVMISDGEISNDGDEHNRKDEE